MTSTSRKDWPRIFAELFATMISLLPRPLYGKYWKPGSLYYGETERGGYISEKEAVQRGYLPSNGTGE